MEFGVGIKFHGIFKVPWNSMELPFWPGKVPWNSGEFHGIPWNSMELWNIDINKFHNWGSVFHCLLHDFMSLYIRQSISSWNIEIFQFQNNFLVPLILVKWRYSILNGGLLKAKFRWYSSTQNGVPDAQLVFLFQFLDRKMPEEHPRQAIHTMATVWTHWSRDKTAAISQKTSVNAFSWMKMHEFRLRFQWSLFLSVQLTIIQHWFRSEPMMVGLLTHICVTRPHWVKESHYNGTLLNTVAQNDLLLTAVWMSICYLRNTLSK